jgi:hypothetical protein
MIARWRAQFDLIYAFTSQDALRRQPRNDDHTRSRTGCQHNIACCQDALATIVQGDGDPLRADQTRTTGYQAQVGDCAELPRLFVAQGIAHATHCGEHGAGVAVASTGEVDESIRWNAAGIRAISANVARLDQRDRFAQAGKPIGDG